MLVFIRLLTIKLVIILTLSTHTLYSIEQPTEINFLNTEEFSDLNGQLVAIRGFLYESSESQVILAAEPNLKSCCVGNASKRQKQLLIHGNIHPTTSNSAITLQGNLIVATGDSFPFRLENAEIAPEKDKCYQALGFVGLGLILLSGGAYYALRKKGKSV